MEKNKFKILKFFTILNIVLGIILIGQIIYYTMINVADNPEFTQEMLENLDTKEYEDTFIYKEEEIADDEFLAFNTSNKIVEVYVEGEMIYKLYPSNLNYTKTTGLYWNLIPINKEYAEKVITVKTKVIYDKADGKFDYYQKDVFSFLREMMKIDIFEISFNIGLLFGTLIMAVNILVNKVSFTGRVHMISVIGVSTCILLWRASEIDIFLILMPNGVFWSHLAILSLTIMPIMLSFYFKNLLKAENREKMNALLLFNNIVVTIILFLQIFRIKDLRETLSGAHYAIFITIIVAVIAVIVECIKEKKFTKAVIHTGYTFVVVVFNLYLYLEDKTDIGFANAGLLLYISYVAIEELKKAKNYEKALIKGNAYKELAQTDIMTGIYNKSGTEKYIKRELEKVSQKALFMIDLDNFKKLNDTFGHQAGDEILTKVAEKLGHVFRKTDVVGRIGGDEFIALMTERVAVEVVEKRAKEILDLVKITYSKDDKSVTISCSIGIALYPEHGKTFDELYSAADKAMYNIKNQNKNSYVIYDNKPEIEITT